jgi:hypothetical protein
MRRWLAGLVAALGAAFGVSKVAAKPAASLVSVTAAAAAYSQVRVVVAFRLAGSPDSVLVTWSLAGAPFGVTHRLAGTTTRDDIVYPAPAPGGTIGGQVCLTAKRRGLTSAPACQGWTYTLADTPPPPPMIDSVRADTVVISAAIVTQAAPAMIGPNVAAALPGQFVTYCLVFTLADGSQAVQTEQLPDCAGAIPAGARRPTADGQAAIDRLCVQWESTGGTIQRSACDVGPPAGATT